MVQSLKKLSTYYSRDKFFTYCLQDSSLLQTGNKSETIKVSKLSDNADKQIAYHYLYQRLIINYCLDLAMITFTPL